MRRKRWFEVNEIDFGDVGDFEKPEDNLFAIVKPKDLRGSKIAASACEPLELQEGTEDFGDVGDFEQPEPHYVPILEYLLEVDDNFQTFDDCIQHICEKFSITLEQLIQVCEDGLKGDYEGYEHLEFLTFIALPAVHAGQDRLEREHW